MIKTVFVLFAILALFLSSCAPAATPAPKPPATTEPAAKSAAPAEPRPSAAPAAPIPSPKPVAEQPRSGGTLPVAARDDAPHFDPYLYRGIATQGITSPTYNGLLQYDPLANDKVILDLAKSWEASADGLEYTFQIPDGVKFHDGKPLTVEDVRYSLERIIFKAGKLAVGGTLPDITKKVEITGKDAVRVSLNFPSAGFIPMMARGSMLMVPKHVVEAKGDLKKDIVGTGPFKLKEHIMGSSIRLSKNPDYWKKPFPHLDGITYYIISDSSTRFAALRTRRTLMTVGSDRLLLSQAEKLKKDAPEVVTERVSCLISGTLFMPMVKPPWNDIRLRRAIFLAIDRPSVLDTVIEGLGVLGGPLAPSEWTISHDELLKVPGYRKPKDADIAEAKRLLAEAGFDKGLKTKILTRTQAEYTRAAEVFADQLRKLGIEATLDPQETVSYTDRRTNLNYDTLVSVGSVDIVDPDSHYIYFTKENIYGFDDPKTFELFAKQTRAMDPKERRRILSELEQRYFELAPWVVAYWTDGYHAYWPEVKNYKAGIGGYNNNRFEAIWLAN